MPRWARRAPAPVLAALAGLLLLTGCGAPAPPPATLRYGYLSAADSLPYLVMTDRGFDKQEGLRLEESAFAGGAAVLDALAAGSLDLGGTVGTLPIFAAAERGLVPSGVVPVATTAVVDPDHPSTGVLVAQSVNGWRDLQGKQIATNSAVGISAAGLLGRLRQEGVRDTALVEIPFANMGLAVAGGNVAAAAMVEPFLSQSLARGDGKLLGWVLGGPPFERGPISMVVVSASLQRQNPEAVKAYLRAHLKAVAWIAANPVAARALLARRLNIAPEIAQKMYLVGWAADGRSDPALLDGQEAVLKDLGLLKTGVPARQLYDQSLLEQVLGEKR